MSGVLSSPSVLERIVAAQYVRWGVAAPETPSPLGNSGMIEDSPFLAALHAQRGNAIIAEVKLGSPRLGDLRERLDPERIASTYRSAGAACLSVVVEEAHFFGSYDLAARCREAAELPLLVKDFLVSERQLDCAAQAGASAVLLIARLFNREQLAAWAEAVRQRGMVPLVELHDLDEVERIADAPWELLGVNQRDLSSFEVSRDRALRLRQLLPEKALAVAESGIHAREDIEVLQAGGFDAFLIGESLLLSKDPGKKLRELLGETE